MPWERRSYIHSISPCQATGTPTSAASAALGSAMSDSAPQGFQESESEERNGGAFLGVRSQMPGPDCSLCPAGTSAALHGLRHALLQSS